MHGESAARLPAGSRVKNSGLLSPDLNGEQGHVLSYIEGRGGFVVKLHDSTKELALNPDSTVEIHGRSPSATPNGISVSVKRSCIAGCAWRVNWSCCGDARAVDPADGAMSRANTLSPFAYQRLLLWVEMNFVQNTQRHVLCVR